MTERILHRQMNKTKRTAMEKNKGTIDQLILAAGLCSAAIFYYTRPASEFIAAAAVLTGIYSLFTALTVNSSVWDKLGCATQNSSKNKYTSKGSYFR